jgi:hypothetical protein
MRIGELEDDPVPFPWPAAFVAHFVRSSTKRGRRRGPQSVYEVILQHLPDQNRLFILKNL